MNRARTGLGALEWEVLEPEPLPTHVQMALEEVLLEKLAEGRRRPTLRFWEWTERTLVLGCNQVLANEVDRAEARQLGFTLSRRLSGGGTMIAEPGRTITYSLYAPSSLIEGLSFLDSYAAFDGWVVECLRGLGVPADHRPINEIVSPLGKIGGAAQARRRAAVLHHTTIAHEMDTSLLTRLLRLGREPVSPRGVRSAEREVSPLARFLELSREEVVAALLDCFRRRFPTRPATLSADELEAARRLARAKYARPEWVDRLR